MVLPDQAKSFARSADVAEIEDVTDFTRSVPPTVPEVDQAIRGALRNLASSDGDLGLVVRNAVAGGAAADREAAARLLAERFGTAPDPARIVVANGTQNLVLLLLAEIVGQGATVLCERLTYSVLGTLVRRAGVRLVGLAIDDDGLRPDAFETACQTHAPKALYCNPTVHNPTTAVMPLSRRREVAEIARRYGVAVIEDDVLGLLHPEAPPPIAALGPDVTWYAMGLTKCLAHGMRVAYLVAPEPDAASSLIDPVRTMSTWSPPPLSTAMANRWVEDGTAKRIVKAIRSEADARQAIRSAVLGRADVSTQPGALHVWLSLPAAWPRQHFAAAARRRGVLLRPADIFSVDGIATPEAVRLSLSSPVDRRRVERGLGVLADLLASPNPSA